MAAKQTQSAMPDSGKSEADVVALLTDVPSGRITNALSISDANELTSVLTRHKLASKLCLF
jgi:hypothetical protein